MRRSGAWFNGSRRWIGESRWRTHERRWWISGSARWMPRSDPHPSGAVGVGPVRGAGATPGRARPNEARLAGEQEERRPEDAAAEPTASAGSVPGGPGVG